MRSSAVLIELGAVIVGLAILARLASRLAIPAIPLYLLAGLAFGKGGVLPLVTTAGFIEIGAEIGLILLLLSLGLEYSARELISTLRGQGSVGFVDAALNFSPGFLFGPFWDGEYCRPRCWAVSPMCRPPGWSRSCFTISTGSAIGRRRWCCRSW